MISRRSIFGFVAAALGAVPFAAVAQVGAMPSSTAPSNSEGTPSGGTGIVGRTQVEPAGRVTRVSNRRYRRRHHHRRHY